MSITFRRVFTAAAIALGLVPMTTIAQQPPGLRLLLETERPSLALGEPAYLIVRVRNEGAQPVSFIQLLRPEEGLLVVSMSGPRAERLGFVPLSAQDSEDGPTALAAGAEVARAFPVFFGAAGWSMRTQGTYTLRARFTLHDGSGQRRQLVSDSLQIRVGDGPASVVQLVQGTGNASTQAGKFLLWHGGDHLLEGERLLASVADSNATVPLADHVRLARGRSLGRPFKDYTRNAIRPADFQRSVAELERVRDDVLPTFLRAQKYIGLANGYRALARAPDALRAATTARTLMASRSELAPLREQVDRLPAAPPTNRR